MQRIIDIAIFCRFSVSFLIIYNYLIPGKEVKKFRFENTRRVSINLFARTKKRVFCYFIRVN